MVVRKRIGHESVKGGKKIGVGAKGSGISLKEGVKSRIYVLCYDYCGSLFVIYEGERKNGVEECILFFLLTGNIVGVASNQQSVIF